MRTYAKSLSLTNSKTLECDKNLNPDGILQNIDDLFQSSSISDISYANLTDNSINNIVLNNLCYASISYPRTTLGANTMEYNSRSTHTFKIDGSSVCFFANSYDTQFSTRIVTTGNITTSGNIVPTSLNGI